jgi:hypothetical protein
MDRSDRVRPHADLISPGGLRIQPHSSRPASLCVRGIEEPPCVSMRTSPVSEFLYANCGAANFGGPLALRPDDLLGFRPVASPSAE